MYSLEITIQRKSEDYWPIIVEQNRPGNFLPVRSEGKLQLDLAGLRAQATPLDYGAFLAQAIFSAEIRDALIRALADSQGDLRVLLFVEDKELAMLRWERLCAPIGGVWRFMATNQQTIFSLYLPSITDRRFPAIGRRDLKALILAASPEGLDAYHLDAFDVPMAVKAATVSLGDIPYDVLASAPGLPASQLDIVGPATLDMLCQRLTEERYTLLHVVCHGQYHRRSGETILYLAAADNQVAPVAATDFITRLGNLGATRALPYFIFLSTCESAAPEAEGALGGLAQRLVRELGLPAVLAMTDKVSVATAQQLASHFYLQLRKHGEVDRAVTEACAGLASALDVVVPALYNRLGGRPLFSDALDENRELTNAEIGYGIEQMLALMPKCAPVLKDEFEKQAAQLRSTLGVEKEALSPEARQERTRALAEIEGLCTEVAELSFKALALGREPPVYDERCPYLGLAAFQAKDRSFFFGRDALITKLKTRLQDHRLLAVLGPSGSGKSSIVLAGLLPILEAEAKGLALLYMTPTQDPIGELNRVLDNNVQIPASGRILVVDQLEEAFTLCLDHTRRQQFFDQLCALVQNPTGQQSATTTVILTMRADFWGDCAPYAKLRAEMQAHQELIAPMDANELRGAMERQARVVGLRFETDLANTILDEVKEEPGAMPLLQHALRELWLRRHGRWLRASEYRAMGGVRQAIAHTADKIYQSLEESDRQRMRNIFIRLTRVDDNELQGEEQRDTRRRVRLEDLVPAGQEAETIRRLVERLADARLIVTSVRRTNGPDPDDAAKAEAENSFTEVEVAHEALIRYWPSLRKWLDEDRYALRLRQTIEVDAAEWEAGQRNENLLPRWNQRLEEALGLAQTPRFVFSQRELDYLNACRALHDREVLEEKKRQHELAEEQRQRAEAAEKLAEEQRKRAEDNEAATIRIQRRARIAIGIGTVAVVFAVIAALFYYLAEQRATAAKQGNSRALAAQAESLKETELDLALLLAVEAYHTANTAEAASSLLSVATAKPGLLAFLPKHKDIVLDVGFSADGRMAASVGDMDGAIMLWDVLKRAQLKTLSGPPEQVFRIAWHPQRPLLASGGVAGNVILWDLSSGAVMSRTLYTHPGSVSSLAFSPDGRLLATGSCATPDWSIGDFCESGEIWRWDLTLQQLITPVLSAPIDSVDALAFSPDGRLLAAGSCARRDDIYRNCNQGEIRLLAREQDWSPTQVLTGHADSILSLAFNPRNANVLVSSGLGGMIVWDIAQGQRLGEYSDPNNFVRGLHFSPTGKRLFSSRCGSFKTSYNYNPVCEQGTILVWDYPEELPIWPPRELTGHTDWVTDIAVAPDSHTLLSGGRDRRLILWESDVTQELGKIVLREDAGLYDIAISPDDQLLAAGTCAKIATDGYHCLAGEVQLRRLITDSSAGVLLVPLGAVQSVAFSPDPAANLLATGGCGGVDEDGNCNVGEIRLWDAMHQRMIGEPLQGHTNSVHALVFSPDGSKLASGGDDGKVMLWDIATRRPLPALLSADSNFVTSITFNADGTLLAASGGDSYITLWDASNGQQIDNLQPKNSTGVVVVAFSPDPTRNLLASGGKYQHPPILWDLDSKDVQPLTNIIKPVEALAFNRAGTLFATTNLEGVITLWDMTTRRAIGDLMIDPTLAPASHLVFDGSGKRLVVNTATAVIVWDVDVQVWEQKDCQRANRTQFSEEEWSRYFGGEAPQHVC